MGSSIKKAILVLGNCSTSTKSNTWVVTAERLMFIVSEETPADTLVVPELSCAHNSTFTLGSGGLISRYTCSGRLER